VAFSYLRIPWVLRRRYSAVSNSAGGHQHRLPYLGRPKEIRYGLRPNEVSVRLTESQHATYQWRGNALSNQHKHVLG
jgi:hypothetical protein